MAARRPKLRFFLDQNVPDSVGRYLQGRGHSVERLRYHIAEESPDPIVGMTALKAGRILVSWDKDFNSQRFRQERFAGLSRISLSGEGPTLLAAMKEHIDVVEFQLQRVPKGGRWVAHIQLGNVRFRSN
jgi:hypothetical protein